MSSDRQSPLASSQEDALSTQAKILENQVRDLESATKSVQTSQVALHTSVRQAQAGLAVTSLVAVAALAGYGHTSEENRALRRENAELKAGQASHGSAWTGSASVGAGAAADTCPASQNPEWVEVTPTCNPDEAQ